MDAKLLSGKPNSQQIGEIWRYLDELSLKNPEEYNKFIKKTLAEGEAQGFGPPEQCFSILTHKVVLGPYDQVCFVLDLIG